MDETDKGERLIRHLNAIMGSGLSLNPKAIRAIGALLQTRQSVIEEQTWGIQPMLNEEELAHHNRRFAKQIKQTYKIVANAQFFHPKYMLATGLSKSEAEAIIKLL
jgi:hypothetical protein